MKTAAVQASKPRSGQTALYGLPLLLVRSFALLAVVANLHVGALHSQPTDAATDGFGEQVVAGARLSVEAAPEHDPTYYELSFPGGDPGPGKGAAADIVVRALRQAGVDLQVYVHQDVLRLPALYRVTAPDHSIDHRRIKNLARFLLRWGISLPTAKDSEWAPGDIVVWSLNDSMQANHIGIVTDSAASDGRPTVVHHLPRYGEHSGHPEEDDVLLRWRVLGHYRVDPGRLPETSPAPPVEARPSRPSAHTPSQPVDTEDVVPQRFEELEGQRSQQVTLGELLEKGEVDVRPSTRRLLSAQTRDLLGGARRQVERAPRYDASYKVLDYPKGDPASDRGASVDLVIRAFRAAGVDLQQEVHEDIVADPEAYGVEVADANIDHRRIRNLDRYFSRNAEALPLNADFQPGDVVIWDVRGGTQPRHLGIVSDELAGNDLPKVTHHLPRIGQFSGFPATDDVLFRWRIVGHYRATDVASSAVRLAAKDPVDPQAPELEPQPRAPVASAAPGAIVELATNEAGDQLGEAVAVGDFDGDGHDDMALASPRRAGLDGRTGVGRVMVFRGTDGGLVPWRDLWPADSSQDTAYGAALVAADFNGDGFDDLAVGAPGGPGGPNDSGSGRGSTGWVYLFQGGAQGLKTWERLSQIGLGQDMVGDLFGWSLAAGDIDGDGLSDLVVGAPGETPSRGVRSGQVFVFRGGAQRLAAWQKIGQDEIEKNEDGDLFGWSVALGDLTGDGLADLAVGAPGEGLGYRPASGAVFLYSGSTEGVRPLQNVGQLGLGRNEQGDDFGWSLLLRDFNHDQLADLIVGAPGEAFGSIPQSGWVFAFYGSSEGVLPWMSLGQDDIGLANEPQDRFGWSLSHGDFDGDGRDDLAIGTPGKTLAASPSEGSLLVCRGGRTDLIPWLSLAKGPSYMDGGGRFGTAVGAGDFDGDRFSDLVVGAPGREAGAAAERGSVFLFKGAADGFQEWLWRGRSEWIAAVASPDAQPVENGSSHESAVSPAPRFETPVSGPGNASGEPSKAPPDGPPVGSPPDDPPVGSPPVLHGSRSLDRPNRRAGTTA